MSIWGRVAAGVGRAGSELASKYIDEELLQQRQQFMSDLRMKETKALDDYQMSEERVSRQREIKAGDAESTYTTQRNQKLRSATDTELNAAETAAADARARAANKTNTDIAVANATNPDLAAAKRSGALAEAQTARDVTKANAADPEYLKSVQRLEAMDPKTAAYVATQRAQQAVLGAQADGIRLSNDDKRSIQQLQKDMVDVLSDEGLTDEQRAQKMRPINARLTAMGGGAKPVDGEKFETTRESVDDKGNKTIEKVSGTRPARGPEAAPPPGAAFRGPDGSILISDGKQAIQATPEQAELIKSGRWRPEMFGQPGKPGEPARLKEGEGKPAASIFDVLGETPMERYRRESAPPKPKTLEDMARAGAGRAPLSPDDLAAIRRLGG